MSQSNAKDRSLRLFVAVPLTRPIANELQEWTHAHREKLPFRKWTHPDDYHITLQFLGETPAGKMDALQAALMGIKERDLALALNGAGTFGPPTAPRILWAAVSGHLEGLSSLQSAVTKATISCGFKAEDRPYTPHITVARGFAGTGAIPAEVMANAPSGLQWRADRFVLMRTHMQTSPMYEVIGEYPLHPLSDQSDNR
ncbi:RNA 2',3'-cyclic phosphodiesterase [Paenibacillus alkaliterrae]|uniref:RNA 2',3'-cyclic phosphodiesterase n=1 Tax=Paenibacillus alkaliterrae TaxID=320909 RepID=UPI001F47F40E|nr:RNA 2',3'-cyclic phosphodiesterase [Paenibacillus alkaliterrae]MCF2939410.1 RNA 2',3'-cyclic phosphodiesterase [Paenibacillus alkaliterrae]